MIITIVDKKITGSLTLNPKSHEDEYLIEGRAQVDDDSLVEAVDLYEYDNGVLSLIVGWEDIKAARDAQESAAMTVRTMGEMRSERNRLLADSDFSQLPDAPVNRDEWATYRQALRDLPSTVDINNPVFPTKPIGG
jgi:hypothetical protein